jgi:hypothetical protein
MRRLVAAATVLAALITGSAVAQISSSVPAPQPATGAQANLLAAGFNTKIVAAGTDPLENPTGVYTTYGFLDDNADPALRTRSEPDQNVYLTTGSDPGGPTAGYDYGTHFLIQGHENGADQAYLTRINLDVTDPEHRITLLNGMLGDGTTGLGSVDGSTYDPFNGLLLFTEEAGNAGHVLSTPLRWADTTAPAHDFLDGSMGNAGYEGIAPDSLGDLYLVEDTGGAGVLDNGVATKVRQPNSFVYRFVPAAHRGDLTAGKLQALQILDNGTPITWHDRAVSAADARDDALGEPILHLHSGAVLNANWITIHDTAVDGTDPFDANALAKAAGATPLKRPENGKFVPGTDFRSFVFAETGDTDKEAGLYPGAAARGAWGSIIRVDMPQAGSDTATVKTVVLGEEAHNSFDNLTFLDSHTFLAAEDRGDTLHDQENALDSVWSYDLNQPLGAIEADAKRLIALGRDPEASAAGAEDNEPTGVFVSDGATTQADLLGANDPSTQPGTRIFFTDQHGVNRTFEVIAPAGQGAQGPAGKEGPQGPKGPAGNGGPTGRSGPNGRVTVRIVLDKSLSHASRVLARTGAAGRLTADLTTRAHGRLLHLAAGSGRVGSSGGTTVHLRRNAAALRRLKGAKSVSATLKIVFRPSAGGRASTLTRHLRVGLGR